MEKVKLPDGSFRFSCSAIEDYASHGIKRTTNKDEIRAYTTVIKLMNRALQGADFKENRAFHHFYYELTYKINHPGHWSLSNPVPQNDYYQILNRIRCICYQEKTYD